MAAEQITGLRDFQSKLREIPKTLRRRVLRNALAAGARIVRDEAKRQAPVLSPENRSVPYRTPGTVRRAISVRTSKADRREGNVGVFVNVRPAKSGARGAKSPSDPFYWRFLEFGTSKMAARPFLRPAAQKLRESLAVFERELDRWITKVSSTGDVK
jgi:HK97 gp10 family phage protein